MGKVVLPQKVAEALEQARKLANGNIELVAWCIPVSAEDEPDFWKVLFEYGDDNFGGFFAMIDALRYGYTVEDPIAEKKAQLKERLASIGYEGEAAQRIVDAVAPIFDSKSG